MAAALAIVANAMAGAAARATRRLARHATPAGLAVATSLDAVTVAVAVIGANTLRAVCSFESRSAKARPVEAVPVSRTVARA